MVWPVVLLHYNIGHHISKLQYSFLVDTEFQIPHTSTSLGYQRRPLGGRARGRCHSLFLMHEGNLPTYEAMKTKQERNQIPILVSEALSNLSV